MLLKLLQLGWLWETLATSLTLLTRRCWPEQTKHWMPSCRQLAKQTFRSRRLGASMSDTMVASLASIRQKRLPSMVKHRFVIITDVILLLLMFLLILCCFSFMKNIKPPQFVIKYCFLLCFYLWSWHEINLNFKDKIFWGCIIIIIIIFLLRLVMS